MTNPPIDRYTDRGGRKLRYRKTGGLLDVCGLPQVATVVGREQGRLGETRSEQPEGGGGRPNAPKIQPGGTLNAFHYSGTQQKEVRNDGTRIQVDRRLEDLQRFETRRGSIVPSDHQPRRVPLPLCREWSATEPRAAGSLGVSTRESAPSHLIGLQSAELRLRSFYAFFTTRHP